MNESRESLTLIDAPVAINIGESSFAHGVAHSLKIRSLRIAIGSGSLHFETTLPNLKAQSRSLTLTISIVGLVGTAALLTMVLAPPVRSQASIVVIMGAGFVLWDMIARWKSRREQPVYPTWIHIAPGTLRWRESNGPIQQIALNADARATLDRFRWGSDGHGEDILEALFRFINRSTPPLSPVRKLLLAIGLALQFALPLTLVGSVPFAVAAMLHPGPRGPLPLMNALGIALLPLYGMIPLFITFVAVGIFIPRMVRRHARRARNSRLFQVP